MTGVLMKSNFFRDDQKDKYAEKSASEKIDFDLGRAKNGDKILIRSTAPICEASLDVPEFSTDFRKKHLVLVDEQTKKLIKVDTT